MTDVHRFRNDWEKAASLALRHGHAEAIDTYQAEGRIHDGDTEQMTDAAYQTWRNELTAGIATVLVTDSNESVAELNQRARADLIRSGVVTTDRQVPLGDGTSASKGDVVITRKNDRRLRAGKGWVRNGDRWTVHQVRDDGSMIVRRAGQRGGSVILPAEYVASSIQLGYAVTVHRAQGITTETSHVLVDAGMTRETLYVAMTRGRASNTAYVAVDRPDPLGDQHHGDNDEATAATVLAGVLAHTGAELSAHEAITAEQDTWGSIAQLGAEYETLASAAQRDRWATLIRASGLTEQHADEAIGSEAFGALTAEMRRAEANHIELDTMLPRLVRARPFEDADDIAAVLHHRVSRSIEYQTTQVRSTRPQAPRLIVGPIPEAGGAMSADMRQALAERRELIQQRAAALLDTALTTGQPWTRALGTVPADAKAAQTWRYAARTIAAYRDRYHITSPTPLGAAPESEAQKIDHERAQAALDRTHRRSTPPPTFQTGPRRAAPSRSTGRGL